MQGRHIYLAADRYPWLQDLHSGIIVGGHHEVAD
jgi:hypothetical protein